MWLAALLSSAFLFVAPAIALPQTAVTTEFRVFHGAEEVTKRTRLVVTPTGVPEEKHTLGGTGERRLSLVPGLYDVQMLKLEGNAVTAIVRVERLLVLHYPDEGGLHLEVLNFDARYGALQLRSSSRPIGAYSFTASSSATPQETTSPAATGPDYVLFVVPAGKYDVHVRASGTGAIDPQRLRDLEVPQGRTRLKVLD